MITIFNSACEFFINYHIILMSLKVSSVVEFLFQVTLIQLYWWSVIGGSAYDISYVVCVSGSGVGDFFDCFVNACGFCCLIFWQTQFESRDNPTRKYHLRIPPLAT